MAETLRDRDIIPFLQMFVLVTAITCKWCYHVTAQITETSEYNTKKETINISHVCPKNGKYKICPSDILF